MDPELRGVIAAVIEPTRCFDDKYERAVWFATMEPQLTRYVADTKERRQILDAVHCEARRVGIPPELVLAVMDVESRFDRFAVSSAGAIGLMQVMPFWPRELGMTNDRNRASPTTCAWARPSSATTCARSAAITSARCSATTAASAGRPIPTRCSTGSSRAGASGSEPRI